MFRTITTVLLLLAVVLAVSRTGPVAFQSSTPQRDFVIKTGKRNHVTFDNVPVTLTDDGVPLRVSDSTPLTGVHVSRVTVRNVPPESNVVTLGKTKPAVVFAGRSMVTDYVAPTGDFIELSMPDITYALKYFTPVSI